MRTACVSSSLICSTTPSSTRPPAAESRCGASPPNGQAHVTIADTGIGIPAEHLPHVFDRFYRVDPSRGPETDGTGLGLAICRSIAEAHGGVIKIDNRPGGGTCVTLNLPVSDPIG